jgi:adenosylcobinamide kinase/adenosylcobinamide-phosphate guanylyltransferase
MKIILITGGQRSGKSEEAERMALSLAENPIYIATARIWDEDFLHRVKAHQIRRGSQWTNMEEDKFLSRCVINGKVAVIDCVTLWAANWLFDCGEQPSNKDVTQTFEAMKKEFNKFISQDATFIFVTNEIGMGGTSGNALQNKFADLQGLINQHIAKNADEVYLMVCGIKVKIKP